MKSQYKNKNPIKRRGQYYVYMVECTNAAYYTGYTSNLKKRIETHNKGHGAKYLRGKLPVKLIFAKKYRYYKNALKAERKLKTFTREAKEKLVREYGAPRATSAVAKRESLLAKADKKKETCLTLVKIALL